MSLLKRNLFLSILLVFIFISCNKQRKVKYIPLDKDLKAKFNFKKGSYWIYRDSISGREDSCYLKDRNIIIADDERSNPTPYELLRISFVQTPFDKSIKEQIDWDISFYKQAMSGQYLKHINAHKDFGIRSFSVKYPIEEAVTPFDLDGLKGTTMTLSELSLRNNPFKDVSVININKNGYRTYFINDSVGYIKMSLNFFEINYTNGEQDTIKIHEVWELMRWSINE